MVADASEEYNLPSICSLDNVVSVVDCLRLSKEFGCGDDLVKEHIEDEDIENLIIQQIEFCNKIVLNKLDQVSEEEKNKVLAVIKKLQPEAEILEAEFGKVPMNKIMGTNSFDFDKACTSAGWLKEIEKEADENDDGHEEHHHHEHTHEDGEHHDHEHHHHEDGEECEICKHEHEEGHKKGHHHHHHHHHHGEGETEEYGIGTFVYYRRKPLIRSRFRQFVDSMPKSIIRSKGIAWYSNDNDNMYIFEQAGPQKTSYKADFWIDALPEPQKKVYVMQNPDIMKDWHEGIGDRMVKLVFIGKQMDKEAIFKALDECLDK
jgi:G3E family GTPase